MGHSFFSMHRIASRSGLLGRRWYSSAAKGGPSIAGVGDIIAVASGKGGVGKSTTAVNIAVALAKEFKLQVGLLDADIYGPSIPTMMNLHAKPEVSEDMKMIPVENHGVRCMSIGFLVDKDAPIVWRGPMVMSALEKMTRGVAWGDLDILVVDMPPGTGDAQLSMSQRLRLSGALIVSTPQDIALIDARRGANMFRKVQVPILGLVENMSCFKCPKCGEKSYIFGEGGAQRTAEEMDMKLLGDVPLEISIRTGSDEGKPIVVSSPDSACAQAYINVAEKVTQRLNELAEERRMGPEILL
ncbi:iron-sulfur protein required for NADH dehydrogenase, mitochondrial-like [Miscanthus floridulus]|uniref:iron-sulfur protein required for NADH dehydrogenase, mitochondrial-like n=1 Tax=Miscanthus floridulus TaxID=154761 RepID=UPI0034582C3F